MVSSAAFAAHRHRPPSGTPTAGDINRYVPANKTMLAIDQSKLNLITLKPSQYGDLGLFCHDLPGIGGQLKRELADFEVEEIPSYTPCGEGEHLFLWVEKRGLSSDQMVKSISGSLDIRSHDIGIAGKKDKNAITRQFVSVPVKVADRIDRIRNQAITVLDAKPHTNKLSTGHNRGNRFKIRIRNLSTPDKGIIEEMVSRVNRIGFPNFYGVQRFGVQGDTAEIGFRILKGDEDKFLKQWRVRSRKKFVISAAQSFLFNRYLMQRIIDHGIENLLAGDVVFKTTGGIFRVEDRPAEQKRFEAGELVPAGPIFGHKTYPAAEEALALEEKILAGSDINRELFREFGKLMPGSRRQIYTYPGDLSWELTDNDLLLDFSLPSGSYATVLLSAFMQPLRD